MTYVKFMLSSYEFASRNRREVEVVSTLGVPVVVSDVSDAVGVEHKDSITFHHRRTRRNPHRAIRRTLLAFDYLIILPMYLKRFHANCLSCHDLIALTIGWLSTLGTPRAQRPALVYDSHEYELGRNTARPRSRARLFIVRSLESFLIKRCAFVIAVNASIADKLQLTHSMVTRPLVVRSVPQNWIASEATVTRCREELCRSLGVPPQTFIAMYHGGIFPGRGLEQFLQALVETRSTIGVVLGNGEEHYVNRLRSFARSLGLSDRVLFRRAVSIDELPSFVGAADVGVVAIQATCESYYLSSPNKLFENIQACTPVIGSHYPEIRRIIQGYGVGLTVDPTEPKQIAMAIDRVRTDHQLRQELNERLLEAKAQLCWEKERSVLSEAYMALLRPVNSRG